MDKSAAKEILRLYRPGTVDDQDPQMIEALKFARQDPELAQWLEAHGKFQQAIRDKLKQIPIPADLKRNILRADAARRGRATEFRNALVPLAAAALIAFLAVAVWSHLHGQTAENDFSTCRERIVMRAQRGYSMPMMSSDLNAIHKYILDKQYPDYALPKPLAQLTGEGCALVDWHERKISMVCLKANSGKEYFLFVMDRAQLQNPPPPAEAASPQYEQVLHLMTASWTQGDKIYILAGPGEQADLKQYLN
jgi:hypothetical protein